MSTHEPWCLAFGTWFGHTRIVKLPERLIPWATTHGWSVLIRDSEIPNADLTGWHMQSNPRRRVDEGEFHGD